MQKTCKYCGKTFEGWNTSRYCCKECKMASHQEHYLSRPNRNPKWQNKVCPICHSEFYGFFNKTYCSQECKRIAELARLKENRDKERPIRLCVVCGKPFKSANKSITCSMECRELQYAKKRKEYKLNNKEKVKEWNMQSLNKHRSEWNSRARERYATSKREGAIALQTKPIMVSESKTLKQGFEQSLGIERLSAVGCKCLRCGHKFNLQCSVTNPLVYLRICENRNASPCPYCGESPTGYKKRGVTEHELQQLYPNFTLSNYRPDWMNGLELDLYDPVSKTALEYHGVKWHCGELDRGLQKTKADLCEANGVHLIQLYDTEWLQKREIVQDKLDAIFHKNMRRIFARKLKVMVITGDSTIRPFLEKNHIQGYAAHKWAVGLWNGLELVAVCTFKYGTAYASGGQCAGTQKYWELNRYATKLGCSVIGGLSRCVKAFFRTHTEVTEVFSLADRRWTSPVRSAYSSSGFVEVERVAPNYQYTDRNPLHELKNKQQFRKSHIALEHPEIYSDSKTEKQMATELGMFQIWDAGKIKYRISR